MANPFEYITLINGKNYIPDNEEIEANYVPFLTNRNFSYSSDTILLANEMNQYPDCNKVLQFYYYYYSVKKRKRYVKWTKPPKQSIDFLVVKKYYKYNTKNTEIAMKLLTKEQINIIKEKMNIGGDKKMQFDI